MSQKDHILRPFATGSMMAGGNAKNIAMSPANPNRLFTTFLNLWPTKQLYFTSDGGASWHQTLSMDEHNMDGWVAGSEFSGGWTPDFSGSGVWSAPIAFHPTLENIALVNGHGSIVRKTENGGVTWKYANSGYTGALSPNGPAAFAWDKTDPRVLLINHYDYGSMLTRDGEDTFMSVASSSPEGAPGGAVRHRNIVRVKGNWTDIAHFRLALSRNDGVSWDDIAGTEGAYSQWENEWASNLIAFHPQDENVLYAGKFRFDNIGASSQYVTLSRPVHGVFRGNGNTVYSLNGNTIYRSTDRGVVWATPYPLLATSPGGSVRQIAIDPGNQDRIYVAVRNGGICIITNTTSHGGSVIYRNDAHGLHKSRFDTIDINSVAVDPTNPATVYAGAWVPWYGHSNGVFRSTDAGMTWKNINGNLGPDINISSVAISPHNGYVYIGSYAGTWKLPPP